MTNGFEWVLLFFYFTRLGRGQTVRKARLQQEWTWRTMGLKGCVQSLYDNAQWEGVAGWWLLEVKVDIEMDTRRKFIIIRKTWDETTKSLIQVFADDMYWDVASVYYVWFMVELVIEGNSRMLWVVEDFVNLFSFHNNKRTCCLGGSYIVNL